MPPRLSAGLSKGADTLSADRRVAENALLVQAPRLDDMHALSRKENPSYDPLGIRRDTRPTVTIEPTRLSQLALARLSQSIDPTACSEAPALLRQARSGPGESTPHPEDAALWLLRDRLGLSDPELWALAVCAATEEDLDYGRALAWLQSPVGGSRPLVGLLSRLPADPPVHPAALTNGRAVATGCLTVGGTGPLPERWLAVNPELLGALTGHGGSDDRSTPPSWQLDELPPSLLSAAASHAYALATQPSKRALWIRAPTRAEGRLLAAAVARELGRHPFWIEEISAGLVPRLTLSRAVPVFEVTSVTGESQALPHLEGWSDPVLAISGPEGDLAFASRSTLQWSSPVPSRHEREDLWRHALGDADFARAASYQRHRPARIRALVEQLQHRSDVAQGERLELRSLRVAAGTKSIGPLARLVDTHVDSDALVVPDPVRDRLQFLSMRCRHRESLHQKLGILVRQRYRPGVRALLVGPSGTGKTLAASWLASELALPLFQVDMASIVSKYIGETEKNLADLFDRAEAAEVVLFFDEADTLFGKRTEVRQASDRYANSQTNYLLQRIEQYDGIVLLASNSRSRFDPAFSRRLDSIIEIPMPDPEQRRRLWLEHLGDLHTVEPTRLNELAGRVELAGGHIRNAVLVAAVRAHDRGESVSWQDLCFGTEHELRKLGRNLPATLRS